MVCAKKLVFIQRICIRANRKPGDVLRHRVLFLSGCVGLESWWKTPRACDCRPHYTQWAEEVPSFRSLSSIGFPQGVFVRSEERRVGEACRSRCRPDMARG